LKDSPKQGLRMIRPARPEDQEALIAIASAIDLFVAPEVETLRSLLSAYFDENPDRDCSWIVYEDGGPVGAAYYAPELYAKGTWTVYFIAVHPHRQGEGCGGKLLHYIEQTLAARGERLLLVETSGLPTFERTRAFYRKHGYEEEARIREFYYPGDDKIIFRKALTV
jgi:ribosomal protein S18 acetylase RimI-like enzyme